MSVQYSLRFEVCTCKWVDHGYNTNRETFFASVIGRNTYLRIIPYITSNTLSSEAGRTIDVL